MTLPASGNSISLSQVNTELGRSATATIDMNDAAVRSLFGVGGSGTTISMSDGWGKSAVSISLTSLGSQFDGFGDYTGSNVQLQLDFNRNGTWNWYGITNNSSGNWATPNATDRGDSYWIRFTRTAFSNGLYATATASTGWLQLNTTRSIVIASPLQGANEYATYTIEISSSSGGSPVLATKSGLNIYLTVGSGGDF